MTAFISTGRSSGDAFFSNVRILAMTPLARFASFIALVIASRASAKFAG
jgi:hypothetical protein